MRWSNTQHIIVYSENAAYNLELDNPYIPSELDHSNQAYLLNSRVDMPPDILIKARNFEKLKFPIRCVCTIDVVISLYYFYVSWLFGCVFTFASINGLMATIYYKRSLMTCYVGYQYFQVAGRATNLGYFIYLVSHTSTHPTNNSSNYSLVNINGSVVHDNYGWEIIILTFMFLAQIYIAKIVTQFYNLLPCDIDRDRVTLASWP